MGIAADNQSQAAVALAQGRYEDAIALYSRCIEANPEAISNYWHLGLAQFLLGETEEAQAVWLSVMMEGAPEQLDGWTAELLQILKSAAQEQVRAGNLRQAIRILEQILELEEQAEIYAELGDVLIQQGSVDDAIAAWQQATALDPTLIEAYQKQAKILQLLGQYEAAIGCYSKVLECDPEDFNANYSLGLCLLHQNQLSEAVAYLQRATQIQSDCSQAYGDLGVALLHQGDLETAMACLHQAVSHSSALVQHYLDWADTLRVQDRLDTATKANAALLQAIRTYPQAAAAYLYLGDALLDKPSLQNSMETAIALYEKALELHSDSAETYLGLGKAWVKSNQMAAAMTAFQQACQLQPDSAAAHFELGKVLIAQGDLDQAIAAYQKAVELDVNLAEAYFRLGDALSLKGLWTEAIACYLKKIELQPDVFDAHYRIGIALVNQGQLEAAVDYLQQAMKALPKLAANVGELVEKLLQKEDSEPTKALLEELMPVAQPNGFYESSLDWANAADLSENYFPIYPTELLRFTSPKTLDQEVDLRFRFGDRMDLPGSFVVTIPDGRYWIDEWNRTAVITPDDKLLGDVSPDFPILSPGHPDKHPRLHSIFKQGKLPSIQKIEGTVAVFSGLFNDAYFHWMFDVLPRLEILRLSPVKAADIDNYLINSRLPFQQESLKRLGVSQKQILEPSEHPHIQADRLVVPSFPASISWMPKWTCDFLRKTFLDEAIAPSQPAERLYITRAQTSNRRVINETEINSLLEKYGFRTVVLESLSIGEQAALLSQAKVIVAPHGGGLTNLVFCQPETKVIELFSPNYVYPCYWLISNLMNLDYYYLLGQVPEGFYLNQLVHSNSRIEDMFIDPNQLQELMKLAGVI